MIKTDTMSNPSIYVACLAAYNNGYLHGCWIDATQDLDDIYYAVKDMLAKSPMSDAEEWEIHSYSDFGALSLSQHESLESAHEKALFINKHGALGAAVAEYYGDDLQSAEQALEDYYEGEWNNELHYATYLFDECYAHDLPEHLTSYIDYKAFCRDLFMGDYFSLEVDHQTHVFSNH